MTTTTTTVGTTDAAMTDTALCVALASAAGIDPQEIETRRVGTRLWCLFPPSVELDGGTLPQSLVDVCGWRLERTTHRQGRVEIIVDQADLHQVDLEEAAEAGDTLVRRWVVAVLSFAGSTQGAYEIRDLDWDRRPAPSGYDDFDLGAIVTIRAAWGDRRVESIRATMWWHVSCSGDLSLGGDYVDDHFVVSVRSRRDGSLTEFAWAGDVAMPAELDKSILYGWPESTSLTWWFKAVVADLIASHYLLEGAGCRGRFTD